MSTNLLSVDWDYFFPVPCIGEKHWQLFDWSCRDSWSDSTIARSIWYGRGAPFLLNGLDLPTTSGDEANFWQRFRFTDDVKLYVSDAHFHAATLCSCGTERVRIYDAHHDGGYRGGTIKRILDSGRVTSEDWTAAAYLYSADIHVIYPRWKGIREDKPIVPMRRRVDQGTKPKTAWDAIHICRSGGWTPPWVDSKFAEFVQECTRVSGADPTYMEMVDPRPFDMGTLQSTATEMAEVRARIKDLGFVCA